MSDKKQIEEMVRDQINGMVKVLEASCDDTQNCSCNCDLCKATALYNAGCRMQSEGEWIDNGEKGYGWAFTCSKCGWIDGYPFSDRHNFCPNCGAKMKGE